MLKETLQPTENLTPSQGQESSSANAMNKAGINNLYQKRLANLELLRSVISLKFYYQITDKLEKEKKHLEALLNLEDQKQEAISHYSFPLNQYFFEQKFLNN